MIRAVIFDLDGVLVDAADAHYRALNRALAYFGYTISTEEHVTTFNGLSTRTKLDLLSLRSALPRNIHTLIADLKQQFTVSELEALVRPDSRLANLLRQLKAEGYLLAVASNSIRETVLKVLHKMEIHSFFDVVLANTDVRAPKPNPEIYLRCLEMLKVKASEVVIIEDSLPGIQAAKQVTSNVLMVLHPRELLDSGFLVRVKAFPEGEKKKTKKLQIVVPMAGRGKRFEEKGFTLPKPLIRVGNRPMIEWVVSNLKPKMDHHFVFLAQEAHITEHELTHQLSAIAPESIVVPVRSVTQGAACTVSLAADALDPDSPLIIANSDQWVEVSIDAFLAKAESSQCDGLIMTFPNTGEKWSYARTDAKGRVMEVAEKRPISDQATVGIYYFRRAGDFLSAAASMIRKDLRTNGEFYVCPVYNELIAAGKNIYIYPIGPQEMHGLGTPEDLESFLSTKIAA